MGQTPRHSPTDDRPGPGISRTLAETASRRQQVVVAGHVGDAATARRHLDDPAPLVRSSALRALHRLDELTANDLITALCDQDPTVRRTAAEVTATWRPDAAGTGAESVSLLPLLRDPVPEVVEMAAWASGERPPEHGLVEELSRLTASHQDALVREAAVAALGAVGDEAGLPAILTATTDKATVRRRAVIALAPFDGDDVTAALHQALTDRDWQVRQAAEDLLADD